MTDAAPSELGLDLALLGFLRDHPKHAYEIHQQLLHAEELGLVWHLKQGHLYALLARLEAAGYIDAVTEAQGNRPPRKVLHLTPLGEAAFTAWVAEPVEHGREFRQVFLAKLFFAAQEGPAVVTHLVERQRDACHALLDALRRQMSESSARRPYERLVLDFRAGQLEAILPWLDQCEEALAPTTRA